MTAQEFMLRYREAQQDAGRYQRRIAHLREQADKIAQQFGGPKASAADRAKVAEVMSALADEERRAWEKIEQSRQVQLECADMIDALPDARQRTVIDALYIQGLTLEEAGRLIDRSAPVARRAHNAALAVIDGILAERQRAGAVADDE